MSTHIDISGGFLRVADMSVLFAIDIIDLEGILKRYPQELAEDTADMFSGKMM